MRDVTRSMRGVLVKPARLARRYRAPRQLMAPEREASLVPLLSSFSIPERDVRAYVEEIRRSPLLRHLRRTEASFTRTVRGRTARGNPYEIGGIDIREAVCLYALIASARPARVVETGVCNGFSTAFILLAMHRNRDGRLYSIDLPEVAGRSGQAQEFWAGKRGAVIPQGKQPGWVIPARLKDRWELTVGRSQDVLPALLERVAPIDFFLHDSEHSYECMSFEMTHAWGALRDGGVLACDDVDWNSAFQDFARGQHRTPGYAGTMGFAVK